MKVHLFANGKMGKMIAQLAPPLGFQITDLKSCDVAIDFSHATLLFKHLEEAKNAQKPVVIGTTGWDEQLQEVKTFVAAHKMGVVADANFSIGVYLLLEILEGAAKKISPFQEYEVAGVEVHHSKKADLPSGTALKIASRIDSSFSREKKCAFASVRTGSIPGEHTIFFDSPCDTITITHTARNREGFAKGALFAAKWIHERKGFYTFKDCMEER